MVTGIKQITNIPRLFNNDKKNDTGHLKQPLLLDDPVFCVSESGYRFFIPDYQNINIMFLLEMFSPINFQYFCMCFIIF